MDNNDLKVDISKEFHISKDKLYAAWTDPEQLKQWWKPMEKNLSEVINDVKEGGEVRYIFEDNSLVIEGEYIEVKDTEKLVYTWNWKYPKDDVRDSNYQLTIEFLEEDDMSKIHIIQENFENEEGILPHKAGWEKGLNDLDRYLEPNRT